MNKKIGSDSKEMPRISLVTPSYNQGKYLSDTIESVISQGYPNLEYIIIDGGSTDNSLEIIKKYQRFIAYWESKSDRGQSHAINKGFDRSTGTIMGWLNSDDLLEKGTLFELANRLNQNEKPEWLVGVTRLVDRKKREIGIREPLKIDAHTFMQWPVKWFAQQSTYWNRRMWQVVGPLEEDLHYIMDMVLWEKMSRVAEPARTSSILAKSRLHSEAKCVGEKDQVAEEYKTYQRKMIQKRYLNINKDVVKGKNEAIVIVKDYMRLADDYLECQEKSWIDQEKLMRIKNHIVIGKIIKLWKKWVNPNFDI